MTKGADIIAAIILLALAIAIIVYLSHWLYRRIFERSIICKNRNAWRKSCDIWGSICITYYS